MNTSFVDYINILNLDGLQLQYIPQEYFNDYNVLSELNNIAVSQNGLALQYVPYEHITEELCEIAVRQNGLALQYIPHEHITEKLCRIAVKQNGYILQYVPNEYITEELCIIAVKQNRFALDFVPNKYITSDLHMIANKTILSFNEWKNILNLDGLQLQYLPQEYLHDYDMLSELNNIAVTQNGLALQYIPNEYITEELCEIALFNNINSIHFISEINKKLLDYVFKIYGYEKMNKIKMDNAIFNNYMEHKQKIHMTNNVYMELFYDNKIYKISYYELFTYFNDIYEKNSIILNEKNKTSDEYYMAQIDVNNSQKIIEYIINTNINLVNLNIRDKIQLILKFLGKIK